MIAEGWQFRNYAATHVPHPWDEIGKPPPLGRAYAIEEWEAMAPDAIRAATILRDADGRREDAQRYEEEADDLERDAEKLLASMPKVLADKIRDDPWAIDNDEDVRDAMAGARA